MCLYTPAPAGRGRKSKEIRSCKCNYENERKVRTRISGLVISTTSSGRTMRWPMSCGSSSSLFGAGTTTTWRPGSISVVKSQWGRISRMLYPKSYTHRTVDELNYSALQILFNNVVISVKYTLTSAENVVFTRSTVREKTGGGIKICSCGDCSPRWGGKFHKICMFFDAWSILVWFPWFILMLLTHFFQFI